MEVIAPKISLGLPELKKMQAITKSVRAKMAVRIVQQTSVDHLLLSYTGNSSALATSLLYILKYLYKVIFKRPISK